MNGFVQPTALNFIVVGLMVIIFQYFWNMAAMYLINRNPESGLGRGMGVLS